MNTSSAASICARAAPREEREVLSCNPPERRTNPDVSEGWDERARPGDAGRGDAGNPVGRDVGRRARERAGRGAIGAAAAEGGAAAGATGGGRGASGRGAGRRAGVVVDGGAA